MTMPTARYRGPPARELAKGKSATEAYEIAGFKPDRKKRASADDK
jgi:hypothetical protein